MFDTMTMTKVVGGVCGAWLVFLLGGWAADTIYTANVAPAAHGEEHATQAYVIEVAGGGEGAAAEEGPSFEELLASADAAAGEKVFNKCAGCHKIAEDGTGPHLGGVVGRPVASVAGYSYKGSFAAAFDVWSPEHLNTFLESPKSAVPDTAMAFNGLPKAQDRANLIAWLSTQTQ